MERIEGEEKGEERKMEGRKKKVKGREGRELKDKPADYAQTLYFKQ